MSGFMARELSAMCAIVQQFGGTHQAACFNSCSGKFAWSALSRHWLIEIAAAPVGIEDTDQLATA